MTGPLVSRVLADARSARPEEIADPAAAMIASDYRTGEVIVADGSLNLT